MLTAVIAALLLGDPSPPPPPCDPLMTVCDVIDPATGEARVWPADVAKLQEDVETCLHFAGEEPFDDERRRQIDEAIEAHCGAVERDLPGLRAKYGNDPVVLERLDAIAAFDAG